jgi:PAS domain S-box-containing protein
MQSAPFDFFQLSPLPMWIYDVNTFAFLAVNPAAVHFYGYEKTVFHQMTLQDIEGPNLPTKLGKEIKLHRKSCGGVVYTHVIPNSLKYKDRDAKLVMIYDYTESLENERRLEESAQRFNTVSKATSDTIWDHLIGSQEIVWNRGIKGVFGHKNIKGDTTSYEWLNEQVHPEDRERVIDKKTRNQLDGTNRWQDEYRFRCGDGTYRYVCDRGFIVYDEQGTPVRIIGAMEDITKRKEYIRAIEEQNKKFKEIAWIQSHMVRAPLARILALVDLIRLDNPDDDYEIMLDYLSSSAKELDSLIVNIADKSPTV